MDNQMSLIGNAFATRRSYIRGIRTLMMYYQRLPERCTVDEIKAFLIFQKEQRQLSSSTVNLRVCSLKYYFREVVHRLDLAVKIPNPRVQKYNTSHRVAITNHRIKAIGKDTVTFEYKDYKDGAKKKLMTLKGTDFLQRFCLHILPQGFRKIRQYGFLANACKAKSLKQARVSLAVKVQQLLTRKERKELAKKRLFGDKTDACPCCENGKMVTSIIWARNKAPPCLEELVQILG